MELTLTTSVEDLKNNHLGLWVDGFFGQYISARFILLVAEHTTGLDQSIIDTAELKMESMAPSSIVFPEDAEEDLHWMREEVEQAFDACLPEGMFTVFEDGMSLVLTCERVESSDWVFSQNNPLVPIAEGCPDFECSHSLDNLFW